ncbi:MAG: tyrosinase family protein [Nannocystaceae bacterium]|nr:tyrosinase family protein [Nannocystaceae bacterium]
MSTIAKLNYARKQAGLPLIRFDLRRYRAEDVQELRDAYAAMFEISETAVGDRRGYTALARGHGYDQDLCHNDNRIFLTWHRAYIYAFEKALNTALKWKRNDPELELTLPFWDWTSFDAASDSPDGIPKAVSDASYVDAAGNQVDNPLASARSLYREQSQGLSGPAAYTQRFPSRLRAVIPQLADDVARYLDNPSFASLSSDFEFGAHGTVHVRVGGSDGASPLPRNSGDMASVVSAAYDPIFWLHHAMVDKVWFDWQTLHPNAEVPQHVLDTPVYGGLPGASYVDAENSLRYIYSTDSVESAVESSGTLDDDAGEPPTDGGGDQDGGPTPTPPAGSKEVYLGTVTGPFVRAQLDFHQLRPPKANYEIRCYVDNADCDAETGYDDPSYAGRLVLFGHGECHGAKGHCNPALAPRDDYDLRPKHGLRFKHTTFKLDMTRGLRRYLNKRASVDDVRVYLVTVDGAGKQVAGSSVRYRGCSLRTFG